MGWEDYHVHDFRIGQQRFGIPGPMEDVLGRTGAANERSARLFQILGRVGARADFGPANFQMEPYAT